jgi:hypothetical protein
MVPWYKTRRAWAEAALILVLTAALLAVVFAACAGDGESADPPATSTTVDPDEAVKEEVRQAYRDFLEMFFRVTAAADPNDPGIAQHTTGPLRAEIERTTAADRARGVVVRGGPYDEQTILTTTVDGDTATLTVCYVDHSGEFDAATGAEIAPMTVVTTLDVVELVREDGVWKVRFFDNEEGNEWQGVSDCST